MTTEEVINWVRPEGRNLDLALDEIQDAVGDRIFAGLKATRDEVFVEGVRVGAYDRRALPGATGTPDWMSQELLDFVERHEPHYPTLARDIHALVS